MLCPACSEIDLEALSRPSGHRLDKGWDRLRADSCELCRFLRGAVDDSIQQHSLPFALHAKRHNPNCPDAKGIAEVEVRQYVREGTDYWGVAAYDFRVTLGVAVDFGQWNRALNTGLLVHPCFY